MKILFSLSFILALLFLGGCGASASPKPGYQKPEWVMNHSEGAVGICDTHMKGDAAQEQVAIDRALEKLSRQQGVEVQSQSVSIQKESAGHYGSGHSSSANIKSNNRVKASIKETWRDPKTNRYYVWMVLD
jgi:hypothetical protein